MMNTNETTSLQLTNDDYLFLMTQSDILVKPWVSNFAESSEFISQMRTIFGEVEDTSLQEPSKIEDSQLTQQEPLDYSDTNFADINDSLPLELIPAYNIDATNEIIGTLSPEMDLSDLENTGNEYLDSLLWGGWYWSDSVITYSFCDDEYAWLDHEIEAVEAALQAWENVADISFVRVTDNTDATINLFSVRCDDIGGYVGMCYPPDPAFGDDMGNAYLAWDWGPDGSWDFGLNPGGGSFSIILHELGHGLGLAHPHDNGGGSSTFPGVTPDDYQDLGDFDLNQCIWTIMSYNNGWDQRNDVLPNGNPLHNSHGLSATPMALDIAAIQSLYGADLSYRTGDDLYTLPGENIDGSCYLCIWDAGGYDTLSAGLTYVNTYIDLNDAPLVGPNAGGYVSCVDTIAGGFTIANGVTIERAIGGYGSDILIGNEANNVLEDSYGDDYLIAGEGHDWLMSGEGHDYLVGGNGYDYLVGGNGYDYLAGQGDDDILVGGLSGDYIDPGAGNDVVTLNSWGYDAFYNDLVLLQDSANNGGWDYIHGFEYGQDYINLPTWMGSYYSQTVIGDGYIYNGYTGYYGIFVDNNYNPVSQAELQQSTYYYG